MSPEQRHRVLRFGPFVLDPCDRSLRKDGALVHLAPKHVELLCVLAERAGHLVKRDVLLASVWPDVFVEEANLSKAVFHLRQALGPSPAGREYIETVPKAGYRFLAEVEVGDECEPARSSPGGGNGAPSLAVMAFADMSPDQGRQWFCEGLAEELIQALARVPGLRVASRTSSFRFGHAPADVRRVGRELGVTWIVEGSVRTSADVARIAIRLVHAADGLQEWAWEAERRVDDIFAVENEVARSIAQAVEAKVQEKGASPMAVRPDEETYSLYLRGRFLLTQRPSDRVLQALECFQEALRREPRLALAHAGVAEVYCALGSWEWGVMPPTQALVCAMEAAGRALAIDPGLSQAHAVLAYASLHYDWSPAVAREHAARALASNANHADALHWQAHAWIAEGNEGPALESGHRALELDPFNPIINQHLGFHHIMLGDPEEAVNVANRGIAIDPGWALSHYFRGWALCLMGRSDAALGSLQEALRLSPNHPLVLGSLGHAFAIAGRTAEALQAITKLQALAADRPLFSYEIAVILAALGDRDAAFHCLDRAIRERSGWMAYFARDARLAPLRRDPRFSGLESRRTATTAACIPGRA